MAVMFMAVCSGVGTIATGAGWNRTHYQHLRLFDASILDCSGCVVGHGKVKGIGPTGRRASSICMGHDCHLGCDDSAIDICHSTSVAFVHFISNCSHWMAAGELATGSSMGAGTGMHSLVHSGPHGVA